MSRQSQTEILKQLLPVAAPGEYDEALNDVEVRGPRGGMRGYKRAPGAVRLGNATVTRVMDDENFAADVHHGISSHYGYHPDHHYVRDIDTGPTFSEEDIGAVRACVWAASTRQADVLTLLADGDAQAAVAKAVELHAVFLSEEQAAHDAASAARKEAESESEDDSIHM